MRKMAFLALFLPALLCRADGLPDLGDAAQATVSPQQERQIGEQSMLEIRADRSYLGDAETNDYLNRIGYQLAANSNEPGQPFEFFALNNNAINAFALPGGFIGVNTGLMLAAQTESELASVLSHEISHVTQHHIARMIDSQKVDSLAAIAAIAVAILAARSNPEASQAAIVGMQAGTLQHQLNFTRTNEQEADRLGLAILQKSGFDAHAMPTFFERLQHGTRLLDDSMPSYLRTHPLTSERIADIDNRTRQIPYRLVADSLDFHLVRARLQTLQKSPQEAIAFFTEALGGQKHGNQTAQRYGLALSLLRAGKAARANREFSPLRAQEMQNPMLATLGGQIRRATGDKNTASFYREAIQNFPRYRALNYDYIELLLRGRQYDGALKLLDEQIIGHPDDPHLYELRAQVYAELGKAQEEHHALAYAYALRGNLYAAIDQLELAKQSGSDYYQLSTIESELRQFRELAAAHSRR